MLESLSIIGANAVAVAVAVKIAIAWGKKWTQGVEETLKVMDKKLDNTITQELCHERQKSCKEVVQLRIETATQKVIDHNNHVRMSVV